MGWRVVNKGNKVVFPVSQEKIKKWSRRKCTWVIKISYSKDSQPMWPHGRSLRPSTRPHSLIEQGRGAWRPGHSVTRWPALLHCDLWSADSPTWLHSQRGQGSSPALAQGGRAMTAWWLGKGGNVTRLLLWSNPLFMKSKWGVIIFSTMSSY